jgi:diguanylate cyclase (GGDEF)-like protein/PAS domain S-box-containing protein
VDEEGNERWHASTKVPLRDGSGEIVGLVGLTRDITERKWAEEALQKNQENLAEAQRVARLGSWEWNPKTGEVSWSDEVFRIYGFAPDEFVPTFDKLMDVVHPDDQELVAKRVRATLRENEPYDFEHRVVRPDGEVRIVHRRAEVVFDEEGEPLRMVGTVHDITEGKQAEEKLEQLHRHNELILNSAGEGIYGLDLQGKTTFVNPAAVRLTGWDAEELIGRHQHDMIHHTKSDGTPYPNEECPIYAALNEGTIHRVTDEVFWRKDGTSFPVDYVSTPIRERGEIVGAVVLFEDITERKQAEEKLKESEERFRSAFEDAPIGVALVGLDGRRLKVNQALCEMLGYSEEELLSKDYSGVIHPEDREVSADRLHQILEGELETYVLERRYVHADEHTVWNLTSVSLVRDSRGEPNHLVCLHQDVTERKEAEEKLRQSEERFRSLIQNATDLITVLEEDGTISYESPTVERILGYLPEERIGKNAFDYLHPDDEDSSKATFAEALDNPGQVQPPVEFRLRHKDGSWRCVETTRTNLLNDPAVKGVVANSRDITERRRTEEALRASEERYRAVMEHSAEAIWLIDPDTKEVLESNTTFQELLGYTAEELKEMSNYDFVAHSRQDIDSTFQRIVQEGKGFYGERKYRRKDGTVLDLEISGSVIPYQSKKVVCAVARDLTERKEAEEALRESEERFRTAFEDAPIGVALVGLDRSHLRVNRAYCEMLGYSEEELLVKPHSEIIHPDDRDDSAHRIQGILDQGAEPYALERRYFHADGRVVWSLSNISLIRDSEGEPSHFVCLHEDITERKELEEQLRHQAFYDSLTDLPNRSLFLDRLDHALARAGREGGSIAVLLIDLDDFKVVNDSLGHGAGNAVLVEVAERLQASVRPGDTVGRIFGDEFAVLLEASAGEEEACRVTERIQEGLQAPFEVDGQEVFVRASIGVALGETDEDQPNELLRHADLAMYEAKNAGNVRYEVYNPSMDTRLVERMNLERDLSRAVEREEFEVHYQPKVLLETGEIIGVEALVRWRHPDGNLLSASQFILPAEETGLIDRIGLWVLKESCCQLKEWQERYPTKVGLPLGLCVNLSAREIWQPDLTEKVAGILQETGLDPTCLMLEITERTAKKDAEQTIAKLRELKELGVKLAIDDFGTGYCSLLYLEHTLLDILKIDRLIVHRERKGSEESDAILSAMISMAHSLNLGVIVEGVETEEQLAMLKEMGCEMGQGHYFAEPLPSEGVEKLLKEGFSC